MTDGSTAVNLAITLKQFALLGIPSWHDLNNAFQCLVETWDVLKMKWVWKHIFIIDDLWLQNYVWVLGWVINIFYSIWPIPSEIEMMLQHWTIEHPQSRRMSLHSPRANHTILCWLRLLWMDFVYENAMRRYNLMMMFNVIYLMQHHIQLHKSCSLMRFVSLIAWKCNPIIMSPVADAWNFTVAVPAKPNL